MAFPFCSKVIHGLLNQAKKTFDILPHSMGLCRTLTERDDKWKIGSLIITSAAVGTFYRITSCEFLKILNTLSDENIFVISHKQDILVDKFRSTIKFEKVRNFSHVVE